MTANAWVQLVLYIGLLIGLAYPLGRYMAAVYSGEGTLLSRICTPIERLIYRLCGIDPTVEMTWKHYSLAVLSFSMVGFLFLYLLQRIQGGLPLNPAALPNITPDSSFNTAVSFVTNTNWQGYGGEMTMSFLTQMLGLTVQNFVSAATGMAILIALIRGFTHATSEQLGNFWVDLTRSVVHILLPLSIVFTIILVSQGVVQTLNPYASATLMQPGVDGAVGDEGESQAITTQTLALGPAASQIAIKQLGTNGGGFFNVNSAHPFENPTPLSNLLQVLAILLIPAGLTFTFGRMVKDSRQGWAILLAMLLIFVPLVIGTIAAEQSGNPMFATMGVDTLASNTHSGGNMEGKETRYGIVDSGIWAAATTAASNGSVNSMHDSYTPLGGLIPMWLMQLGEVVFGGVGSGLYGMLMFAIVAVFIAGLMVGRTPEYLGKKIEAFEMKMASLAILVPCLAVLIGTAVALSTEAGRATIYNPGIHGFSEVLYEFSSAANNNGSAFAGLGANNPFYNTALGICMLMGRFLIAVPVLAIAGSLARKKSIPPSVGTLPTHGALFVAMLVGVVLLVGALTFVPALGLGPIIEQLRMLEVA